MMSYFKDFIDLVYPQTCLCCHTPLENNNISICLQCQYDLPLTQQHLQPENTTAQKFWGRIPLKSAFSYLYFVKDGKVQKLLHHLKYNNNQEVGELLGRFFGNDLTKANLSQEFDLLVPIPLHPTKLYKRGYNQVDCIARGMSETMKVVWQADALLRTRANTSQTKHNRLERLDNANKLFEVKDENEIKGKNILLIDDVITTGATIEAAAEVLLSAGCQSLSIAALATTT
jgi:ComF family protein